MCTCIAAAHCGCTNLSREADKFLTFLHPQGPPILPYRGFLSRLLRTAGTAAYQQQSTAVAVHSTFGKKNLSSFFSAFAGNLSHFSISSLG